MERYTSQRRKPKHPGNFRMPYSESKRPAPRRNSNSKPTIIGGVDAVEDPLVKKALKGETLTFTADDPALPHPRRTNSRMGSSGINGRRTVSVDLGRSLSFLDKVRWQHRD